MGFLGVGVKDYFFPPVQVTVVDVRLWQKRGAHNELEANQVKVASIIVLNFTEEVYIERLVEVQQDLRNVNSEAKIIKWSQLELESFANLKVAEMKGSNMDHNKSHRSSCSVDLPDPISSE